jgi:HEAT repeat protein
VAGGKEVVGALGKLLADGELYEYAALALLAIQDGAAEQFRKALPGSAGKRRLTVVQALGVLRDASSAGALKKLAGDPDRDTRLAALWALAKVGDPSAADVLIKAADAEGYERTQATKACLVLAERLLAAGRKAEAARVYTYLRDSRTGPAERYVRDAATRGLAAAK